MGGWPGSPENVSCSRATPKLHRCKSGVALEQETFSELPGHPPKRLLAPSPIDLGTIRAIRAIRVGPFRVPESQKLTFESQFLQFCIPSRPFPPRDGPRKYDIGLQGGGGLGFYFPALKRVPKGIWGVYQAVRVTNLCLTCQCQVRRPPNFVNFHFTNPRPSIGKGCPFPNFEVPRW